MAWPSPPSSLDDLAAARCAVCRDADVSTAGAAVHACSFGNGVAPGARGAAPLGVLPIALTLDACATFEGAAVLARGQLAAWLCGERQRHVDEKCVSRSVCAVTLP